MNEFEDLLRFLDTGLNRKTPLLHPFDSLLAELSPPTADSSLLRRTIRREGLALTAGILWATTLAD